MLRLSMLPFTVRGLLAFFPIVEFALINPFPAHAQPEKNPTFVRLKAHRDAVPLPSARRDVGATFRNATRSVPFEFCNVRMRDGKLNMKDLSPGDRDCRFFYEKTVSNIVTIIRTTFVEKD